jgi:YVTN family beta-propeller protein
MNLSVLKLCGATACVFTLIFIAQACTHKPAMPDEGTAGDGGYPAEINQIIMTHCTTGPTGGGCHNSLGAVNAAGLRLDTWDALFYGSNHGATVIPYDTVNSPLLHYINNDSSWGPVAIPTMPYTGTNFSTTPLPREDYIKIRDWIAAGAPDKNGIVPFSANPDGRQKIYITEQGSDILSVIDAERHVIMRNINIGMTNTIESPHCTRVSPDGKFVYVSFMAGDYLQKIETATDRIVGQVQLSNGNASWNLFHISDDGKKIIIADFISGDLKIINTENMLVLQTIPSGIANPHGLASMPSFDTFYVTAQYGNTVVKLYADGSSPKKISLDGNPTQYSPGTLDPHEILMTPDRSRYFVTCEWSNEVRVFDTKTDTLIAVIPTPKKPQELAISRNKHYMLVSCMEAGSATGATNGAVLVIDYQNLQVVNTIWGNFWQPHGLAVDEQGGTFYVTSTNQSGPSSGHNHTSGGKHGWYNLYNLETFQPVVDRQYESLILPYSADSRFKPVN